MWDPEEWGGITSVVIASQDIWMPDEYIYETISEMASRSGSASQACVCVCVCALTVTSKQTRTHTVTPSLCAPAH